MQIQEANLQFNGGFSKRMRTTAIVEHHSGVTVLQSVQTIHDYYLHKVDPDGSTYVGIGYHYYVRKDGSIWRGRPEYARGGHAGKANDYSIGICCEGDFTSEIMGQAQYEALLWLNKDIISRNGNLDILKHSDVMPTSCPGNNFPFDVLKSAIFSTNQPILEKNSPNNDNLPLILPGSRVTVSLYANTYATGESIANFVKGSTYTVQQVAPDRVLLKEIMSWVKISDIVITGQAPAQPIQAPATTYLTVSTRLLPLALNVRAGGGGVLRWMPKGSKVELIEKTNANWYQVKYNGITGWSSTQYLK